LIFNCYDTLIIMGEPVNNYLGTWNTYESYWAFIPSLAMNVPMRQEVIMTIPDLGINYASPTSYWFEPTPPDGKWYHIEQWVDNNATSHLDPYDVLYIGEYPAQGLSVIDAITIRTWQLLETMSGDHLTVHHFCYDFNIRESPVINFVDNTGAAVDTFDINDAEYTFEKTCARSLSPTWMFNKPIFDQSYISSNFGMGDVWASVFWAKMILDAFEIVSTSPPVFRINMGIDYSDVAFKQILTQTWSSIMSREWCLGMGDFDTANFYVDSDLNGIMDWWQAGHLDRVRGINAPYDPVTPTNYCGTGPYRVTTAGAVFSIVLLERNVNYWKGWPAAGRKSYLEIIQIDYVAAWVGGRSPLFTGGNSDVTVVTKDDGRGLLDSFGEPSNPNIKTVKNMMPVLSMEAALYTWYAYTVPYNLLYTQSFPTGAPSDFMTNIHVRNAFSYCFSHYRYINEAYYGEATCRETPGIFGIVPDYYTKGPDPPYKFNYDLAAMEAELKLAMFTQGATTQSVWDWGGFHIDIINGTSSRSFACENIKAGFDALNAASGKSFTITIASVSWSTYLNYMQARCMPIWFGSLTEDLADADTWYRAFMHSLGSFSSYQSYPATTLGPRTGENKDKLIDLAVKTPDGPLRAAMYADLDDIYLTDNPGFPIGQPMSRRWCQYWVKGWYYNALYPSQYYYHLYKEDACWADVTSSIHGIPDGVCNMRDISYIVGHFGARAPNPSVFPLYDPKWAPGTYGCEGCDVYGDRRVDMRDVAFAASHFLHTSQP
jgi:hypothetical protein